MRKMRYFRKRVNRGVVLGVLLLISVILFTVISDATFKNVERDRIKAMTEDYISDYTALFADHLGKPLGTVTTAEEMEHMTSDFTEFSGKYFVYRNNALGAGLDRNAKNMEEIKSAYSDNLISYVGNCQVLSASISPEIGRNGIEVKKAGPKNATVTVSLTGNIKLSGDMMGVYFPGMYVFAKPIGEYMIDENGNLISVTPPTPDDAVHDCSCMGSASLFLEKIDGEWKIVYVNYAYLNVDVAESERGAYSK